MRIRGHGVHASSLSGEGADFYNFIGEKTKAKAYRTFMTWWGYASGEMVVNRIVPIVENDPEEGEE